MPVESQLEAEVIDFRNSVSSVLIGDVHPHRHVGRSKVAQRRTAGSKEKHFLARNANPSSQKFGKNLRKPRSAGIDSESRASGGLHKLLAILHAFADRLIHNCSNRSLRQQEAR